MQVQHLTQLSIELHVRTRRDLRPDPEYDPICAIFYHIVTDTPTVTGSSRVSGILCVDSESTTLPRGVLSPGADSLASTSERGTEALGESRKAVGESANTGCDLSATSAPSTRDTSSNASTSGNVHQEK